MTISVRKPAGHRFRRIPQGTVAHFWTTEENIPVLYDVLSQDSGIGGVVFRRPHLQIPRDGKKGYDMIAQPEHTETFILIPAGVEREFPFGTVKGS